MGAKFQCSVGVARALHDLTITPVPVFDPRGQPSWILDSSVDHSDTFIVMFLQNSLLDLITTSFLKINNWMKLWTFNYTTRKQLNPLQTTCDVSKTEYSVFSVTGYLCELWFLTLHCTFESLLTALWYQLLRY